MRRLACFVRGHRMTIDEVWRRYSVALVWMSCARCGAKPVGQYGWTGMFSDEYPRSESVTPGAEG